MSVSECDHYIFTSAWGFRRCSFRLVGQCEGLYTVERVTDRLHALFTYDWAKSFLKTANQEPLV